MYASEELKCVKRINSVVINVQQESTRKHEYYPCLCEAVDLVLRFGRFTGVCPIVPQNQGTHIRGCRFVISRYFFIYSWVLLVIFFPYLLISYSIRINCGPSSYILQWYVLTGGYLLTDFDSLCALAGGLFCAKRICIIFEKLSTLLESISEMQRLKKMLKQYMIFLMLLFLLMFGSYVYIGVLRIKSDFSLNHYCNLLDSPMAVFIRGVTIIFPLTELIIIMTMCIIIKNKYQNLAEKTQLTITTISTSSTLSDCVLNSLKQLVNDHRDITFSLKEINACFGFQILVTTSACLYTAIYYLYRYSTSSKDTVVSNSSEKIHYVYGLTYRTTKLLIYMILGQLIETSSLQPLHVLQEEGLSNMPFRIQQEVQTLLLQWNGKKGALSAMGVIKMGPWLLAPAVGNIITYLLVALQFEDSTNKTTNITAILDTIF